MRYICLNLPPILLLAFICLPLSACMLGPDFHSPRQKLPSSYTEKPLGKKTVHLAHQRAGKTQRFMIGADIPPDWWHLYHSRQLNQLIEQGLVNSPTLASSQAALRRAEEALNVQVGNLLFPSVNAGLSGERERLNSSNLNNDFPSSIFNVFNASVNVAYTLDVFGGARRQIESLRAQVDYQHYELIASYLTLTSNIATTFVTAAALGEEVRITKMLIKDQRHTLDILQKQYKLGAIALDSVLSQQVLLEQSQAKLPQFEQALAKSRHALAVLVGEFPNHSLPKMHLSNIKLPTRLPVSVPSKLVRQRPDVQAAESLLHAASAQIGVATANLFPQFTLSGSYGYSSGAPSTLFQAVNKTWNWGGAITQPIFQGGALLATRRLAIAEYDQAFAEYKQTVLTAFQNVADALRAVENDARKYKALKLAEMAAQRNMKITTAQYQLGGASYLTLLTAQQQYQQTIIDRVEAEAARYNDTTALFQALGGGWWNKSQGFCHLGTGVKEQICSH